MNEKEIQLFVEFKKLDNLCKDLLSSEKGVTSYIEEMENTPLSKQMLVSDFDETYKMLKHVRWIRNDIAHGNGNSECEQEDIDFVCDFYKKILSRTDPFAIIRKAENEARERAKRQKAAQKPVQKAENEVYKPRTQYNYSPEEDNHNYNNKKRNLIPVIIILLLLLILFSPIIWNIISP